MLRTIALLLIALTATALIVEAVDCRCALQRCHRFAQFNTADDMRSRPPVEELC